MFFFFKQNTAYEMRISDWSSDVCSSDLGHEPGARQLRVAIAGTARGDRVFLLDPPIRGSRPFTLLVHQHRKALQHTVVAVSFMVAKAKVEALRKQIGRASCRERVRQYV